MNAFYLQIGSYVCIFKQIYNQINFIHTSICKTTITFFNRRIFSIWDVRVIQRCTWPKNNYLNMIIEIIVRVSLCICCQLKNVWVIKLSQSRRFFELFTVK